MSMPAISQSATMREQTDAPSAHVALSAEQLLQLQAELLGRKGYREAATALAQQLTNGLACDRASIGWCENKGLQIVATSYLAEIHSGQETARLVTAAMEEAVEQGLTLTHPESASDRPHILLAHAALAKRQGHAICTAPLSYNGRIVGALTLERSSPAFTPAQARHIERVATLLAPPLHLKYENNLPLWQRCMAAGKSHLLRLPSAATPSGKLIIAGLGIGLALLVLLVLLPTTYRISAPARLEGLVQRALTAPVDGYLHQVHARPGDHVKAGQVLAELADQDMRVEQRGLEAEHAQHENALISAQARSDRAEYIVSQGRAEAILAKLDMLGQQLERSQLRAPFDGIVIKGDLSQSIGAPVERGAELITMAPDTGYRVMIEVEEVDIAELQIGQTGRLMLAALPAQVLPLRVERITPLASTDEGRHYFAVYAILQAEPSALRPGMQGYAKIEIDQRPMLLHWGRRGLNWLRLTFWSWGA